MKKEELEELIDILHTALVHYRLWEELMKRRDQDSVDLINRGYATFIEFTRNSHYKAIFVELHKLIEIRSNTFNLNSVLKDITEHSKLAEEVEIYNVRFKSTVKGIFILRNSVFGHASRKMNPKEAFEKASITSEDIENYIVESSRLLNKVKSECFNSFDSYNEIGEAESVAKLYAAIEAYERT